MIDITIKSEPTITTQTVKVFGLTVFRKRWIGKMDEEKTESRIGYQSTVNILDHYPDV